MGLLSKEDMGLTPDGIGPPGNVYAPEPVGDDELDLLRSVVRKVFSDVAVHCTLGELMAGTEIDLPARTVELTGPEIIALVGAHQPDSDQAGDADPVDDDGDPEPLLNGLGPVTWDELNWLGRQLHACGFDPRFDSDTAGDRMTWESKDGREWTLAANVDLDPWTVDTDGVLQQGEQTD